jgi:hypothetical protein
MTKPWRSPKRRRNARHNERYEQAAPFNFTDDGGGVDGPLAVNPIVTEAPAASDGAQLGAAAVNVVPDCVTVAFHPFCSVTPEGTVQVAVHGLTTAVPVLRTVTEAWKPPCHALSILTVAEHEEDDGGGDEGGGDDAGGEDEPPPEPTGGIKYG